MFHWYFLHLYLKKIKPSFQWNIQGTIKMKKSNYQGLNFWRVWIIFTIKRFLIVWTNGLILRGRMGCGEHLFLGEPQLKGQKYQIFPLRRNKRSSIRWLVRQFNVVLIYVEFWSIRKKVCLGTIKFQNTMSSKSGKIECARWSQTNCTRPKIAGIFWMMNKLKY